jgi:hypothetical protein
MSLLRPKLPRLALAAMTLILMGALVAAPSVSGAKNAVKQFTASIDPTSAIGGVAGPPFTLTVTNCGGPELPLKCTLSSTIGLGSIRIAVPTEFQPIAPPVSATSSPPGRNWTASYNTATRTIDAFAVTGSDKLQPGESIGITFNATPTPCPTAGAKQFTTSAWGSNAISGTDPFALQGDQPTVTVAANEACVAAGGSVTGPGGQTETITGNFQGHLLVTFGGNLSCSTDPIFGSQWFDFHLPNQVNIIPGADFVPGTGPKVSTSTFTPAPGADSSWYLICFAVPTDGHTAFTTRGGGPATVQTINGTDFFVGILPDCYNPTTGGTRPEPCVSEQFLTFTTPHKVVISVRMQPGDPFKR